MKHNTIKTQNIIIKNSLTAKDKLIKPNWIKIKLPLDSNRINFVKYEMKKNNLNSVCKEACCPNINECFNYGTATFMILGVICTRKCPFCNIQHGRPMLPDITEPVKLAKTIINMKLKYVVITSVDRDDLYDGGANHFAKCINEIRKRDNTIKIEILVPDFRNCMYRALDIITSEPPDVFSHNIETVPRIYDQVRPSANYNKSMQLLKKFKIKHPNIPSKSSLMLGLGETNDELIQVMNDLRKNKVNILTLGQYLQPSKNHLPVQRYVSPQEFNDLKKQALSMGFNNAVCGPLVRSSYQAHLLLNKNVSI
ncbi:MAG: lipoyl synthase [Pantoea sp. Brub]|nr:lipoyl synthase [Pantoea sp. Brub]